MNVSGVLLCQVNIVYPTHILLKTNIISAQVYYQYPTNTVKFDE